MSVVSMTSVMPKDGTSYRWSKSRAKRCRHYFDASANWPLRKPSRPRDSYAPAWQRRTRAACCIGILKPSNIMMDERGRIRIVDFGLAVAISNNVREVVGTPAYMSPEQRAGAAVTVRSDLYALGRVLEEILPTGVDLRVSAIVQRCLAIDPSNRPTSAYEVAAGLPDADARGLSDFDIPSPAMVAATPTAGAVAPATAWLLLAAIVGGSLAIARAGGTSIVPSQLPKPPEVLAERARANPLGHCPARSPGGRPRILVVVLRG